MVDRRGLLFLFEMFPASYRQVTGKLATQRRKRRLACHAVNRQPGAILKLTHRRLGAGAKVTGEAAGAESVADQQPLQYARDIALPTQTDIEDRRLGARSEYPVHHKTGVTLPV